MAKLIVLALAFAALVAFASARRTIITTTVEDDIDFSRGSQCGHVQQQRFNQCQKFLSQMSFFGGNPSHQQQQQPGIEQCCQELQNVQEQCQCEAVKQVFKQAQQQQGQQGGRFGSQQTRQLKQMVQNLPNQCKLQTRQCQIPNIMTNQEWCCPFPTVCYPCNSLTSEEKDTVYRPGSQQCSKQIEQQSFNKCQRYMTQQSSSSYDALINPLARKQSQDVEQCCEELRNVDEECKCEAVREVFRQAKQQQEGEQQTGRQSEQQLREKAQNLPRQCKFQTQQCRIPSAWF